MIRHSDVRQQPRQSGTERKNTSMVTEVKKEFLYISYWHIGLWASLPQCGEVGIIYKKDRQFTTFSRTIGLRERLCAEIKDENRSNYQH